MGNNHYQVLIKLNKQLRHPIPPLPDLLYNDFRAFLCLVWQHLNLPPPTPVQLDIAHYLQHGPKRKGVLAFRGVGKSWITSTYVVWRLRINPLLKFLVVSASKDRADNFSIFTMRLIKEIPILQCLIPDSDQRESNLAFDVRPATPDHAPSVTSKGITSQLSGARAEEIIADDVEVPNNSATQALRDKLGEAVKEFDAILKPNGSVTFLGTPQCEDSLYNKLTERGYTIRIWPARFPTDELVISYAGKLAPSVHQALLDNPKLTGKTTDPLRFSEEDLAARELSYGKSGFALQFMLDTSLSDRDRYPLKLRDLIVMDVDPHQAPVQLIWCSSPDKEVKNIPVVGMAGDRYYHPLFIAEQWKPYTGSLLAIDPSGRGADETGYAVSKMLNGYVFVPDAGGFKGGYDKSTLEGLATIAVTQKVNTILIESNFGDGMFAELLKPYLAKAGWRGEIQEVRSNVQKELRICGGLEPVMNQHRLVIDKKLIERDFDSTKDGSLYAQETAQRHQLFYQMTRITPERGALTKDDRLDALHMAVTYWTEQMSIDAEEAVKAEKEALMDKELSQWAADMDKGTIELSTLIGATVVGSVGEGSSMFFDNVGLS